MGSFLSSAKVHSSFSEASISLASDSNSTQDMSGVGKRKKLGDIKKYSGTNMNSEDLSSITKDQTRLIFSLELKVLTFSGSPIVRDVHESYRFSLKIK